MPELDLTRINIPRAEKWVADLRSGKFKQGQNTLFYFEGEEKYYCCLGVACETAIHEGANFIRWSEDKQSLEVHAPSLDNWLRVNDSIMPRDVAEWFGFYTPEGALEGNPTLGEDDATTLNDEMDWSFDRIADAIDELLARARRAQGLPPNDTFPAIPLPGEQVEGKTVIASVWVDDEGPTPVAMILFLTGEKGKYYGVCDITHDGREWKYYRACRFHVNIVPAVEDYQQSGGDY